MKFEIFSKDLFISLRLNLTMGETVPLFRFFPSLLLRCNKTYKYIYVPTAKDKLIHRTKLLPQPQSNGAVDTEKRLRLISSVFIPQSWHGLPKTAGSIPAEYQRRDKGVAGGKLSHFAALFFERHFFHYSIFFPSFFLKFRHSTATQRRKSVLGKKRTGGELSYLTATWPSLHLDLFTLGREVGGEGAGEMNFQSQ